MSKTKLYAVVGKPILHSRSPDIFNTIFDVLEIAASYTRLAAVDAEEAVKTAKAMEVDGLNITSPFKEHMLQYLDRIDNHALKINSVNCIVANKKVCIGYNTDFIGAVKALKKNGINPKNKQITILGAGGAARAAAYGLIKSQAKKVILMNRTTEHARRASRHLGCEYAPLNKAEEIINQSDVLISCIPSDQGIIKPEFLKKPLIFMDANYKSSTFILEAKANGCRVINGLDWLLHQAFPSFHVFFGQEVPINLQKRFSYSVMKKNSSKKNNIALIGFMGSGKTTIGKLLAKKMRFEFIDTDRLIEKSTGMTIQQIFKKKGESVFREKERLIINAHIPSSKQKIFSLGGGAILNKESLKLLSHHCHVIWLWISEKTALKRINISTRPLLHHKNSIESAKKILENRIHIYAKASDLVISTENGDAEKIARRIKDEVDQAFYDNGDA